MTSGAGVEIMRCCRVESGAGMGMMRCCRIESGADVGMMRCCRVESVPGTGVPTLKWSGKSCYCRVLSVHGSFSPLYFGASPSEVLLLQPLWAA